MAVLYHIWVPAFVLAHLLGVGLLLYSVEKVSGIVSKTYKRALRLLRNGGGESTSSTKSSSANDVQANGASLHVFAESQWADVREIPLGAVPFNSDDTNNRRRSDIRVDMDIVATHPQCHEPRPMDLSWSGIACDVQDQSAVKWKRVLKPCSGKALPGQVVAFLGPSGAGKSTLLDILADRKSAGKLQGEVLMNGKPRDIMFRRVSAYVPQEEVFVPTMSALETISFHAKLSMPASVPDVDRRARMESVLSILGLSRVKLTTVGGALPGGILVRGLSGGEKRRLAIACALVASPSILFLDEPTTGLDSYAALSVMEHMSALAKLGHTIITTIHQPRAAIWAKFHKVSVLSEGYQLYFGPVEHVQPWFSQALGYPYCSERDGAISDWLMDLVSIGFTKPEARYRRTMSRVEDVKAATEAFVKDEYLSGMGEDMSTSGENSPSKDTPSSNSATVVSCVTSTDSHTKWASGQYAASWWTQFCVLLKRALLAQLRNPTDASCRLLMSCWVGTLAGLVFFNLGTANMYVSERLALLFFVLLLYELLPFCYMSFYVADRRFFAADIANGLYHPFAYYCAAIVAGAPFVLLNTIVGSMAAYGLSGMRNQGRALVLNMLLTGLQSLISTQLQIFCVWLTPNQDLAYVMATAYVATSILLSGFYIRLEDMRVSVMRGLSYLSYTKYAMQGVSRLELLGRQFDHASCPTAGNVSAALGPVPAGGPSSPASGSMAQPLLGGTDLSCATSGESLLDYWGYDLTVAQSALVLLGFYLLFHVASYFSLSRLYRQRR